MTLVSLIVYGMPPLTVYEDTICAVLTSDFRMSKNAPTALGDGLNVPIDFIMQIRMVWPRTDVRLRELPPGLLQDRAVSAWTTYGTQVNINRLLHADVAEYEVPDAPILLRCAWRECLCHDVEATHTLKVCNSCKRSRYCSTLCQRR